MKDQALEKPRRRGRPRSFDKGVALEAMTEVFWSRGFSASSLDELSGAAGIARPSLYAAFGDKEAMYLSSLRAFAAKVQASMTPALSCDHDLEGALRALFTATLELYAGPTADQRGCLVVCTATAEAAANPRIQAALREVLNAMDQSLAALLRAARDRGELGIEQDVDGLALMLSAVLHSLAVRSRAGEDRAALEHLAKTAIRLVVPP